MSNDVVRFDTAPIFIHYVWIGPIQALFILYFLHKEVGYASLVGILAVAAVLPIQSTYRLLVYKDSKVHLF